MSEREDELEMISYDGEGRLEKRIKIKSICKLYRCCHHQTHVGPDITPQSYGKKYHCNPKAGGHTSIHTSRYEESQNSLFV